MIARSALHDSRMVGQLTTLLVQLQRDIAANASAHVTAAQDNATDLAALQGEMAGNTAAYQRLLALVTAQQSDTESWARLVAALASRGIAEADVLAVLTPLIESVAALRTAPMASLAEIETACTAVLAIVNAPPSLWVE